MQRLKFLTQNVIFIQHCLQFDIFNLQKRSSMILISYIEIVTLNRRNYLRHVAASAPQQFFQVKTEY